MSIQIINYHHVHSARSALQSPPHRTFEEFQTQLKILKRRYRPLPLEELVAWGRGELAWQDLPQKSFLLTFDDGLRDHLRLAPFLQDLPSIFFPATRPLEVRSVLPVHKIQYIIANSNAVQVARKILDYAEENQIVWKTWEKRNNWDTEEVCFVKNALQWGLPSTVRPGWVDALFADFVSRDEEAFWEQLYLRPEELGHLSEEGHSLGCHTSSHPHLSKDNLDAEVERPMRILEKIAPSLSFRSISYPHGSYSKKTLEYLQSRSFCLGFTIERSPFGKDSSPLTIPRLDTNDFPVVETRLV